MIKNFLFIVLLLWWGCGGKEVQKQFTLMDNKAMGIQFENQNPYTEDYNTYTYRNFYNGGGVALGDINNDGLTDIYFTGNLQDNKLYLNKGNWRFEDITTKAGVACKGVWSTGATLVDINGDGWLDIYVCKGGKPGGSNRHNELFINQGDLTFKEMAKEYGLDVNGLSIHAAFFDYDKDGDLDCYLLNNSLRSVGGFDFKKGQRNNYDAEGNKFFKNENGKFIDFTREAGIYSSNIGYGLGITLSDFNLDGWTDIFLSNDFFEKDYLYLNNTKGGFVESGEQAFASMSMGSMGADAADLDNDLLPELFVTEMLPENLIRRRTKNQYETWDKYQTAVENGYHHQFSRNVLQKNLGQGRFLEIGRKSEVAATEWSWAALMQDFDNDGLKDIFVSNGLYKDLLDRDYLNFFANDIKVQQRLSQKEITLTELIDSMASEPVENAMFKNNGGLQFTRINKDWGLDQKSFSNGSAYGDLDNDGDLDLVVNNVNMPCFIYKNNTDTLKHRSIRFQIKGQGKNTFGIGTKIEINYGNNKQMVENFGSRGFQSSTNDILFFGTDSISTIDTVKVYWNDRTVSYLTGLTTNKIHNLDEATIKKLPLDHNPNKTLAATSYEVLFHHKEPHINMFLRERLLIDMYGFAGPAIATADVNNDGKDDVFCGGGKNQTSSLLLSDKNGRYAEQPTMFDVDLKSDKVKARFFDGDNDGDVDLYVAHGGKSFSLYSTELNDAYYINDGKGQFTKKVDFTSFPHAIATGDIVVADFDKDGFQDLVITEAYKADLYGHKGGVYLLRNKHDNSFECISPPALKDLGMVTSAVSIDINQDGWHDLVVAGKWMPIYIVLNDKQNFKSAVATPVPGTSGLWNTLYVEDMDNDGDEDLLCGNYGENNFYRKEDLLLVNDFDKNGIKEQLVFQKENGKYYPVHDIDEIFSQMPYLKKKYLFYEKFANIDLDKLFTDEQIKTSLRFELEELRSVVLLNNKVKFTLLPLPEELQFSTIHAFYVFKNKKGNKSILAAGNDYRVKPQFGRQDASLAWKVDYHFTPNNTPFLSIKPLYIEGQIRNIASFGEKIIFAANNGEVRAYEFD